MAQSLRYSAPNRRIRAVVVERAGGRCEIAIPGVCLGVAGNIHHRESYGMGGRPGHVDTAAELLAACGSGTTGCHGWLEHNRAVARAAGWLARRETAAGRPVLYRGRWVLLVGPSTVATEGPTVAGWAFGSSGGWVSQAPGWETAPSGADWD
jgi:ribosomal protein L34